MGDIGVIKKVVQVPEQFPAPIFLPRKTEPEVATPERERELVPVGPRKKER